MGAFMIFRIRFKERKYLKAFVKKYNPSILVEDNTPSTFSAWRFMWKPNTLICYMGFMGYGEPAEFKKELRGKILYFDWMPINDLNCRWNKSTQKGDKK